MNHVLLLGFALALGLRHAADPDHVIAVTAIAARTRRVLPALWLGVVWGIGHTMSLLCVGTGIILFNLQVSRHVSLSLEFAVGVALIAVGLLNLKPADPARARSEDARDSERIPIRRALFVGLLHGLAGSAGIALLLLATIREPLLACWYLVVFSLGTLLAMALVTTSIAAPLARATRRWSDLPQGGRLVTGAVSVLFGTWVLYQIGWRDGLLTAWHHLAR